MSFIRKQKETRQEAEGGKQSGSARLLSAGRSDQITRKIWSSVFCLLTAFCLLPSLQFPVQAHDKTAKLADDVMKGLGFDQRLNDQVPLDLSFLDETGKNVKLMEYFGEKPVMLIPLFYKCGMLCPEEMNALIDSLKEVKFSPGQDFEIVILSIDPRETPADAAAAKKNWVQMYGRPGTEKGWHLLTGQEPAIESLTKAIGFKYVYDTNLKQYAHPDGGVILTPQGKIARYFLGLIYPPRDLKFGLIEASANKIGSPIDLLWLSCYRYNPHTGKYSIGIMNLVRVDCCDPPCAPGGSAQQR